jgi:plasmid replication initiation protein
MKNEKHTVVKANALIEGRKTFSLLEMKLLLTVISQIKKEDKDFERYRVNIQEFQKATNVKGKVYEQIRNTANTLKGKNIELETETGHHQTSYFSDIFTYKNQGYIDCYISPFLKPYLLDLISRGNFTIYDIRNVINCKSVHSIRIYQLLKQYEKLGSRTITVEDLKFILGLDPGQYTRWANFKARILESAKRELKKHSDIYFEYETKRRGRKIHSITFHIKKQRQQRLFDGKPEPSLDDAIPAAAYHKPADDKLHELEEAEKDAGPIPDEIKKKLDKWT